jgi:hypothetical protein
MGAHIRRVHPRDAFGFNGRLINRRRITRRGLPYGRFVPEGTPVSDTEERGVIFMALECEQKVCLGKHILLSRTEANHSMKLALLGVCRSSSCVISRSWGRHGTGNIDKRI